MSGFPPEMFARLGNYVYRLMDPAAGATFYVGRGVKNRCFSHIDAARRKAQSLAEEGEEIGEAEGKFNQIRSILKRNEEIHIVVHRHGLSVETAKAVEAALIDAYPCTHNKIGGELSNLGSRSANDLIREFAMPSIPVGIDLIMCVNVSDSLDKLGGDVRDAACYAWNINELKWGDGKPILLAYSSEAYGEVLGVFQIDGTEPAESFRQSSPEKFPPCEPTRKALHLVDASDELVKRYKGKRIPARWRQPAPTYPK